MSKNEKPKLFFWLKLIGALLLIIGIILVILGTAVSGNSIPNLSLMMPGLVCIVFSIPVLFASFIPNINKTAIKTVKYLQQNNKEDLKDIVDTTADISGDAITKTAKAIKKSIKDTKYCKECGEEIDKDSKFCSHCGKEQ